MTKDRLSSDNLFHFKSNIDSLNSILTNGFRHNLWAETIPYKNSQQFNFMCCFCDIRIEDTKFHRTIYGDNAIVLTKEWGLRNNVNPVRYVTTTSPGLSQNYIGIKNRYREIRKITCDHLDTVAMHYLIFSVLKMENKLSFDSATEELVLNPDFLNEFDKLEKEYVGIIEYLKETPHIKPFAKFTRSLCDMLGELHNELEKRDSLMRAYKEDFTHPATNITIKDKVLYDEREWRSVKYADYADSQQASVDKFLPKKYNLFFSDTDVLAILLKDQENLEIVKNHLLSNKTLLDPEVAIDKLQLIDNYSE